MRQRLAALTVLAELAALASLSLFIPGRHAIAQEAAAPAGAAIAQEAPATAPVTQPASGPVNRLSQIVLSDDEARQRLVEADTLFRAGKLAEAIRLIQSLLDQESPGLLPAVEKGRLVSSRAFAFERLASAGEEALRLYREVFDPPAEALYKKGLAECDANLLAQAARRYRFTACGAKALATLGELALDRGDFDAAAWWWRQALDNPEAGPGAKPPPEALARLAVAYRLAQANDLALELAERLAREYPGAEGVIGGQKQDLHKYVMSVAFPLPPASMPTAVPPGSCWYGYGATRGGAFVSCSTPPAGDGLAERWRRMPPPSGPNVGRNGNFLALSEWLRYVWPPPEANAGYLRALWNNVPGMLHAVYDQRLLLREDEGVVCLDTAGKEMWRIGDLPVVRRLKTLDELLDNPRIVRPARKIVIPAQKVTIEGNVFELAERTFEIPALSMRPAFRNGADVFRDLGQYAITAEARPQPPGSDARGPAPIDRLFVLADFAPTSVFLDQVQTMKPDLKGQLTDDSRLVAIAPGEKGKVLWSAGRGEGADDFLKGCKFLCVPACRGGRLFAVALSGEAREYNLLCLDAHSGAPLWRTPLANGGRKRVIDMGGGELHSPVPDWAAIPTVTERGIFVVCAGAVAAFDPRTGEALWAYEYPLRAPRPPGEAESFSMVWMPANPLLVCGERAICLPADGELLFAISLADGMPLWQANRRELRDLSYLDANRVLLSGTDHYPRVPPYKGPLTRPADFQAAARAATQPTPGKPGFCVLDAATGKPLYTAPANCPCMGRPVVTCAGPGGKLEAILPGVREIDRLRLDDYSLRRIPVPSAAPPLGNLFTWQGLIVSAGPAGVWAAAAN